MATTDLYLRDVLTELLDQAREAKANYAERRTQSGEDAAQFEAGRALAFYEVVSLLVQQLDAFSIDRESVGLARDLDIDRELL